MSESDGSDASNDSGSTAESEIFAAVRRARSTLAAGAFTEALALLLYLAAEAPPLGAVLEYEILAALQGATVGRSPRQAAYLYSGVESALPRSASAAVAHGGRLHSDGEHLAALICFERALKIDPTNAPAQEGLENLRSFAAERWHFRMVNDRLRNSTYNAAICRAVEAWRCENGGSLGDVGPTVLDVGAGTGVLSLMAARAGAGQCWGVEVNSLLCSIARATIAQPCHALFPGGPVHILNAHSSDLACATELLPSCSSDGSNSGSALGKGCLPEGGVDIVVTELVDSGLVGEHIIAVLRHARQSLLKPGGQMIPQAATLYARPVSSPALRLRLQLLDDKDAAEAAIETAAVTVNAGTIEGGAAHEDEASMSSKVRNVCFKEEGFSNLHGNGIRRLHGLRCQSLFASSSRRSGSNSSSSNSNTSSSSSSSDQCGVILDEQYTCEDLGWFPHTPLANWTKALDLDFAEICRDDNGNTASKPHSYSSSGGGSHTKVDNRREDQLNACKTDANTAYGINDNNSGSNSGSNSSCNDNAVLQSTIPFAEVRRGRADAIAVCFRLILDRGSGTSGSDGNNDDGRELSFGTFPGREENGWDQGIYPLASSNHFATDSGTNLHTVLDAHDKLSFHLEPPNKASAVTSEATPDATKSTTSQHMPSERTSGVTSIAPDAPVAVPPGAVGALSCNIRVGEGDLAALNDRPWHEALVRAARVQLCRKQYQDHHHSSSQGPHLEDEGVSGITHSTASDPTLMTREMHIDRLQDQGVHWVLELCGSFSVAGVALAASLNAKSQSANDILEISGREAADNTKPTPQFEDPRSPDGCAVVIRATDSSHAEIIHALSAENGLTKPETLEPKAHLGDRGENNKACDCVVEVQEETDGADLLMEFAGGSREGGHVLMVRSLRLLPSVIVLDIVSACGLLRQGALEELAALRLACTHLRASHEPRQQRRVPNHPSNSSAQRVQPLPLPQWPRVVPEVLHLVVVPLECSWLWNQSAVRPDAAPGIDLSPLDNLAVSRFRELPLCFGLPHSQLAAPQVSPAVLDLRFESCARDRNQANDSDGQDDDGLARAPSTTLQFKVTQAGTLHAFAFWFRQQLYAGKEGEEGGEANVNQTDEVIDTGPWVKSARVQHWRQAAVAVAPPRSVQVGQILNAVVRFGAGVPGGVDVQMDDSE